MPNDHNDEKLPLSEIGPAETFNAGRNDRGISPVDPESMPRAEDDDETYANSPEYHDRPNPGPPQK
jgi:hypothetical protein